MRYCFLLAGPACCRVSVTLQSGWYQSEARTLTSAKVQKSSQSDKCGSCVGGRGVLSGFWVSFIYILTTFVGFFIHIIYDFLNCDSKQNHEKH